MLEFSHPADFKHWLKGVLEGYKNGTATPVPSVAQKMRSYQRKIKTLDRQVDEFRCKKQPLKQSRTHLDFMSQVREYKEWLSRIHPEHVKGVPYELWGVSKDKRLVHQQD